MREPVPLTPAMASWTYRLTSGLGIVGLTAGAFASTVITNEYGGM